MMLPLVSPRAGVVPAAANAAAALKVDSCTLYRDTSPPYQDFLRGYMRSSDIKEDRVNTRRLGIQPELLTQFGRTVPTRNPHHEFFAAVIPGEKFSTRVKVLPANARSNRARNKLRLHPQHEDVSSDEEQDEPASTHHGKRGRPTSSDDAPTKDRRGGKRKGAAKPERRKSAEALAAAEVIRLQEAYDLASVSLRFLVFGNVRTDDDAAPRRKGVDAEVLRFFRVWCELDESASNGVKKDGRDCVKLSVFLDHFGDSAEGRLRAVRVARYIVGNNDDPTNGTASIAQLLAILWQQATESDIHDMILVMRREILEKHRIATPPVLAMKKRRQLVENFEYMDSDHRGDVSFDDLVAQGLLGHDDEAWFASYDENGTGRINCDEFVTMVCPCGYRAHKSSRNAQDKEGRNMMRVRIEEFDGWMYEDDFNGLPQDSAPEVD